MIKTNIFDKQYQHDSSYNIDKIMIMLPEARIFTSNHQIASNNVLVLACFGMFWRCFVKMCILSCITFVRKYMPDNEKMSIYTVVQGQRSPNKMMGNRL